jgi:hypothetical protein
MSNPAAIVKTLLEADEVDPKKFAMSHKEVKEYHNVVFMSGDDAREALDILNERGEEAAVKYLSEWDYGDDEYSPSNKPPWGALDLLVRFPISDTEHYILSYSLRRNYISLTRVKTLLKPYGLPDQ